MPSVRLLAVVCSSLVASSVAFAQPLPGGTLDPTTIPKYVTPLVIPPVMNDSGTADVYSIAVREFDQQILPGGHWRNLAPGWAHLPAGDYPATTVWSYGPSGDPTPTVAPATNSQFNYPAYTVETMSAQPVDVQWRNELVVDPDNCDFTNPVGNPACDFLPHLFAVDQTLHWANPQMVCSDGTTTTDCEGVDPLPYDGPVPIVVHLHGAHVDSHSDGYPEAWWMPAAGNLPAGWATNGGIYDDANGGTGDRGYSDYFYRNDQPATTIWFHDHALGMTRQNVYAGPAAFWIIRGGWYDGAWDTRRWRNARLPRKAPVAGQSVADLNVPGSAVRKRIRDVPIVIQDRSFNQDGSLWYPDNRAFFEGLNVEGTVGTGNEQFPGSPELRIDFDPNSDVAPIWNPEAFFNTMVVNGVTWPLYEVAPAIYRLRLLNGCNSRFLNLAMFVVNADGTLGQEIPFYQIGGGQGMLPQVVEIKTGFQTPLWGFGIQPPPVPAPAPEQALIMGSAERFDVLVDFSGIPSGTRVRMINTAPDAPFGGFPDMPADPGTTGQIMEFLVDQALYVNADNKTTKPHDMWPRNEFRNYWTPPNKVREVTLNEGESEEVCIDVDAAGNTVQVPGSVPPLCGGGGMPFGPTEAMLGIIDPATGASIPLSWTDETGTGQDVPITLMNGVQMTVNVTENPTVGDTEEWEIHNLTVDSHPMHMHLVRFLVTNRRPIGTPATLLAGVNPNEAGYKDTVIAYPGEITTVRAKFELPGLYVWHCHILEHEDNEMMRPFIVSP